MGDYGFGLNSNVRALSPVDFNQLTNNQSLFSPEPHGHTMQDETLLEKAVVKQQQLSPNGDQNGDQSLEESLLRKAKEGQNGSHEEKKNMNNNVNDSVVNSVANSLNQLGLSEPTSTAVISSLATTPSFWSTATADDTFIQGFQALNGTVTFQNFPPAPNPMFNTNMTPQQHQLGLNHVPPQQQPPQRRAITGQHQQHQHNYPQRHQQSNLFLNNTKTYPTWSSAPQQSSWSQNQQTLNPWGGIQQQRRSVPNLNPIGAPVKKPQSHHQAVNSSMLISPSKFRRSTSFPGQIQQSAIGTKPTLDFPVMDEHREANSMLGLHQVRTCKNSRWLPVYLVITAIFYLDLPFLAWFTVD